MSVTIKELTNVVSETAGVTKRAGEEIVAAVFAAIGAALKNGEEVTVRDFGRFYGKTRPARTGRNPRTGESVQVPEKTVIKFSPRGSMK